MATNAVSDMLRQKESPTRSRRKAVQKNQLLFWRSLYNWVVYLKILIREHLFHVNLENWEQNASSFSQDTWHQIEIRERKGPSQGVIQKCAPHARKAALPKNINKFKNSDRTTFYSLDEDWETKNQWSRHPPLQRDQKSENS